MVSAGRSHRKRGRPAAILIGRAILAVALLGILLVTVALGWRWLRTNQGTVIDWWTARYNRLARRFPGAARFVVARVECEGYLGLHLTVGFAISVAALWLFAGITEDVLTHDPLTRFDLAALNWIRARSTSRGDAIFQAVSLMGSPVAMAVIGIAGMVATVWRRNWVLLAGWVAAFAGAGLLTLILKIVIKRPRPTGAAAFLHGETFSFPSGHALGSLVGYGILGYLIGALWMENHRARGVLALVIAGVVVAIGASRLYLGVHYFSDVVAGYSAGSLWLSFCISGLEVARRRRRTDTDARAAKVTAS